MLALLRAYSQEVFITHACAVNVLPMPFWDGVEGSLWGGLWDSRSSGKQQAPYWCAVLLYHSKKTLWEAHYYQLPPALDRLF